MRRVYSCHNIGNVTAFKSLIQAGANKFTVDRDNLGVLHCAARHGHAEILELMVDLSPIKTVDMKVIFDLINSNIQSN